jgi:hypothetical protein
VGPGATRELTGSVQIAGQPVSGATVTLYAAGAADPANLAEGKTDDQGAFTRVSAAALLSKINCQTDRCVEAL